MMTFTAPTATAHRHFFEPDRAPSDGLQHLLRNQVGKLLERLHRIGVKCEIAGSFARGSQPLVVGSEGEFQVEVVIVDDAGMRDFRIWEIAWDEVPDAHVSLVFVRNLAKGSSLTPNG